MRTTPIQIEGFDGDGPHWIDVPYYATDAVGLVITPWTTLRPNGTPHSSQDEFRVTHTPTGREMPTGPVPTTRGALTRCVSAAAETHPDWTACSADPPEEFADAWRRAIKQTVHGGTA